MNALVWLARRLNRLLEWCAVALAAVLLLFGGYCLCSDAAVRRSANLSGQVLQYKPSEEGGENPSLAQLQQLNRDVIGWLTVPDTPIDYPLLQGQDDLEYVNHDVQGEFALSGAIFLSCQNAADFGDRYSLVYGHHMENRAMFGCLPDFLEEAFFLSHKTGTISLPQTTFKMEFFACVETDAMDPWLYNIGKAGADREGLLRHIQALGGIMTEMPMEGPIAAFSTCSDARTNGRVVLLAKVSPYPETEKRGAEML